ncbi:MAG: CarD family transcriptional regulator [Desulforegulaceae bacterium]|nr:CarD family transcriptional regulator [Desulforegulaceae bacterium]
MEEKEMVQASSKTFSVGELAVYPAHGVGRIESIETKEIGGTKQDFYILKILENGMVIMIPTVNVDSVGLRDVIEESDIAKIYEVMQDTDSMTGETQTWNRRYREYMDKLKTGSIYDVAEVFRDLFLLRITKDLSFGERKLLDTAQSLLLKELCLARNSDEETMMAEIENLFADELAEEPKES